MFPRPNYQVFREPNRAITFLRDREDVPVVVKADGLAAGKGVFVCKGRTEAIDAVQRIGRDRQFGEAGNQLVIEERLDGQEASVLAITDGRTIVTLPAAQDHKAAFDGDTGPNTGGMGAYCPTPLVTDAELATDRRAGARAHGARHEACAAAVPRRALRRADDDQSGAEGAGVQRSLRRSGVPAAADAVEERSGRSCWKRPSMASWTRSPPPVWDPRPAVCVVMASDGYPGEYERGLPIRGLEEAAKVPDVKVFHAGTAKADGRVVTNGGRVLAVTALGGTISSAKLQPTRPSSKSAGKAPGAAKTSPTRRGQASLVAALTVSAASPFAACRHSPAVSRFRTK